MGKTDFSTTRSYSMPIGMYKMGLAYTDANEPGSPFYDSASAGYFPSLTFLPQPSVFLLLIESSGHTLTCGRSTLADFTTRVFGFDADQVPAVDRHGGGGVNCLFGDFHVEFVSSQVLTNQDAISCAAGNPWFMLK
jgi:prepilin-type processing-associated H-X9-DG protein